MEIELVKHPRGIGMGNMGYWVGKQENVLVDIASSFRATPINGSIESVSRLGRPDLRPSLARNGALHSALVYVLEETLDSSAKRDLAPTPSTV